MKHNLIMTAETPEPGVFVTIIRDGDEIIDTVKGRHPAGVAVCAYRPGHSKPLRPIYGLTAGHVKPEVKALKAKGYEVEIVELQFDNSRGTIIYPDGKVFYVKPQDGKKFSLAELYKLLDCQLVQVLYLGCESKKILILDEEGKFKKEPKYNARASKLAYRFHKIRETDRIVGTVMLCDENLF